MGDLGKFEWKDEKLKKIFEISIFEQLILE